MTEKVLAVIGIIFVVVVVLVVALLGNEHLKEIFTSGGNSKGGGSKKKKRKKDIAVDGPKIKITYPGGKETRVEYVNRMTYTIGSGAKCSCVINDDSVESVHCCIRKVVLDGHSYFELLNKGEVNPVVYYNPNRTDPNTKKKGVFEEMLKGETQTIGNNSLFYLGNVRVKIETQSANYTPPTSVINDVSSSGDTKIYHMHKKDSGSNNDNVRPEAKMKVDIKDDDIFAGL